VGNHDTRSSCIRTNRAKWRCGSNSGRLREKSSGSDSFVSIWFLGFPEINSESNRKQQSKEADPTEDDAGDGNAFAFEAEWIAANLPQGQVAKYDGSNRADASHPEETTDETADGETVGSAWRENNGWRIGIERAIQSGIKPSSTLRAL
jgi:hypothetical protein